MLVNASETEERVFTRARHDIKQQLKIVKMNENKTIHYNTCYICKCQFHNASDQHSFYGLMCQNCGDQNYQKRQKTVNLIGKTAIVTGGS